MFAHNRATNYAEITQRARFVASVLKIKTGWRALVARKGQRQSKVFATRQQAKDWAARQEYLILNGDKVAAAMTFGALLQRYAREQSPKRRGSRWEIIRIEKLCRDDLTKVKLGDLCPADFASWRDRQLRTLAPASVSREMQLMSSALTTARKEWGLISENPLSDVRKPQKPAPRERLPTPDELDRLAFSSGGDLNNKTARAFHAFLFAIETAMRAGEIVGLEWSRIDLDRRVARLTHTKNGYAREVPLSSEAVRLLKALPRLEPVFGLNSSQLASLWAKVRNRAGADGLTFHDSRHEAITRLSRKLDILALARMVGHRDLRQLQTYYNESAEELAKRLD